MLVRGAPGQASRSGAAADRPPPGAQRNPSSARSDRGCSGAPPARSPSGQRGSAAQGPAPAPHGVAPPHEARIPPRPWPRTRAHPHDPPGTRDLRPGQSYANVTPLIPDPPMCYPSSRRSEFSMKWDREVLPQIGCVHQGAWCGALSSPVPERAGVSRDGREDAQSFRGRLSCGGLDWPPGWSHSHRSARSETLGSSAGVRARTCSRGHRSARRRSCSKRSRRSTATAAATLRRSLGCRGDCGSVPALSCWVSARADARSRSIANSVVDLGVTRAKT